MNKTLLVTFVLWHWNLISWWIYLTNIDLNAKISWKYHTNSRIFRARSYTFKICAIVFDHNSIYLKNTLSIYSQNHKLYTFILNYILNIFITLNLKTYRKKLWKLFQVRESLLVIMHLRARTILSFVFMLINAWYIETFLCIEIFLSSWNYFSETRICYPLCVNHFWI